MVNENEKSLISTRQKTTKVSFIKTDTLYGSMVVTNIKVSVLMEQTL